MAGLCEPRSVYFNEERQRFFTCDVDPGEFLPKAFYELAVSYPPGMYLEQNVQTEAKDVSSTRGTNLGIVDISPAIHSTEVGDELNSYQPEFAISSFEKFKLDGLLPFLYEEGSKRWLVSKRDPGLPDGWWSIRLRSVVEICHEYRPLIGAKLSFQFIERSGHYYLKGIHLPLTEDGSIAGRTRPAVPSEVPKDALVFFMNL